MSRFFATGSDSESEESSSADEITPKAPGTTFKQSVQSTLNLIHKTQILLFIVISCVDIVFTGHCYLVMMKRTLREWCEVPKTKGLCGIFLSSIPRNCTKYLTTIYLNALISKS